MLPSFFRPARTSVLIAAALAAMAGAVSAQAQTTYQYQRLSRGLSVTPPAAATPPAPTAEGILSLSTATVDFGSLAATSTLTRQVLVSNTGTGGVTWSSVPTVTGAAAFGTPTTTCNATLAVGQDCLVDVSFSPTSVGSFLGSLALNSSATGSPHQVTLRGSAFNPLALSTATLGAATVGGSYSVDFTKYLAVSGLSGYTASNWAVSTGTLPPGLSLSTAGQLQGTPSTQGTYPFTVRATYQSVSSEAAYSIDVAPASVAKVQLSVASIEFDDTATNSTVTRPVTVTNTGNAVLTFTAAPSVQGSGFAVSSNTCGATLAPSASCQVEVSYAPTVVAASSGKLTLATTLASSPHEVSLQGAGFNPVTLSGITLISGTANTAYSYDFKSSLSVSNETTPDKTQASWQLSGTLPAGLTFNSTTGVLSGTPTAVTPSTTLTVTATYKGNTSTANFSLTILGPLDERCANGEQTCAVFTQANAHAYIKVESPLLLSTIGGAAPTTSAYASARASRSVTTGKHYWEMTRLGTASTTWNAYVCGIAPLSFSLTKLAGYEGGYGFAHSNAPQGSVYGCRLDLDAGTLTWTLNGVVKTTVSVTKGVAYAPTPGLYSTDRYQFNFGQSAFTYSVPTGYRPGVY